MLCRVDWQKKNNIYRFIGGLWPWTCRNTTLLRNFGIYHSPWPNLPQVFNLHQHGCESSWYCVKADIGGLICIWYVYIYIYIYIRGPVISVGLATELRAERSGIESRWGRDFPPVQIGPGAHPASCKMGTGSFPGEKCGRSVLLTPHPLLVPRSWKSRAIHLPTLWATTGLKREHFTFIYIYIHILKCTYMNIYMYVGLYKCIYAVI